MNERPSLAVLLPLRFLCASILLLGSIAAASGQGLAPPGNALLMAAIMFTFVLAPPGRVMGLDAALRARLPRWMV